MEKQTIWKKIKDQIVSNLYSMILETVMMVMICSYAVYEIRQVKSDVN